MDQELNKKTAQELMRLGGEARGVVFKTDEAFIIKEKGKDGLKKLETELEKLSCPIKYQEIKNLGFYPIGWRIISLLVIEKNFNFNEGKIKEMGANAPKISLILKFFIQYFLSLRKTFEQVPKMWRKHYTVGDLIPVKLDEAKKTVVLRLENVNLHPIFCRYITGYFQKTLEMMVKAPVSCEETKCFFRGDNYHEYLFKW